MHPSISRGRAILLTTGTPERTTGSGLHLDESHRLQHVGSKGPPSEYKFLGNCKHVCQHCGALIWQNIVVAVVVEDTSAYLGDKMVVVGDKPLVALSFVGESLVVALYTLVARDKQEIFLARLNIPFLFYNKKIHIYMTSVSV
ncbi:hypothetical protein Tco_1357331 [Tanacetum coccineum]